MAKEYIGIKKVSGPIIYIENIADVGFGEVVQVTDPQGRVRHGRVLSVGRTSAAVEIFEGTSELSTHGTKVRFLGHPLMIPVSTNIRENRDLTPVFTRREHPDSGNVDCAGFSGT